MKYPYIYYILKYVIWQTFAHDCISVNEMQLLQHSPMTEVIKSHMQLFKEKGEYICTNLL